VQRNLSPISQPTSLSKILKRPEIMYRDIADFDGTLKDFPQPVIDQVEYEIKYEGFIARQTKDIEKFRHIEKIKIPEGIDYTKVPGLSIEIQQKLARHTPTTLGQAKTFPLRL
jgi:tRNA uridine 5-carboxymethylaminomethyl modification enzyme